jgi:hypothetical protein
MDTQMHCSKLLEIELQGLAMQIFVGMTGWYECGVSNLVHLSEEL